jgi:general L-amino acid transport system substrate-binding protein
LEEIMSRKAVTLALSVLGVAALLGACQPAEPVIVTQEVRVVETQEVQVNVPVEFVMESARLQAVRGRDRLVCGVNTSVPGFGFVDANGQNVGFDPDICRAIAAAIFGDAAKVEFRPLTAAERFTALQTNEIDVLSRNTTWTLGRDVELGTDFAPTTFYDGQGMMVRQDSGFASLADMGGATICVLAGTTTEANLATPSTPGAWTTKGWCWILATPRLPLYDEGRCDGLTQTNRSWPACGH